MLAGNNSTYLGISSLQEAIDNLKLVNNDQLTNGDLQAISISEAYTDSQISSIQPPNELISRPSGSVTLIASEGPNIITSNSIMTYSTAPTFNSNLQLIDKQYCDTGDANTLTSSESFTTNAISNYKPNSLTSSDGSSYFNVDNGYSTTNKPLDLQNNNINDVADPTTNQQASTKHYTDQQDANTLSAAESYTNSHQTDRIISSDDSSVTAIISGTSFGSTGNLSINATVQMNSNQISGLSDAQSAQAATTFHQVQGMIEDYDVPQIVDQYGNYFSTGKNVTSNGVTYTPVISTNSITSYGGNRLLNVGNPVDINDGVSKYYTDHTFYNVITTLNQIQLPNASVSLNSQKISNLANGTLSTDAINLGQLTSATSVIPTTIEDNITAPNSSIITSSTGTISNVVSPTNLFQFQNASTNVLTINGSKVSFYQPPGIFCQSKQINLSNPLIGYVHGTTIVNSALGLNQVWGIYPASLQGGSSTIPQDFMPITVYDLNQSLSAYYPITTPLNSILNPTGALSMADQQIISCAAATTGQSNSVQAGGVLTLYNQPTDMRLCTSSLNMNSQKITGLAAGSNPTDAVIYSQLGSVITPTAQEFICFQQYTGTSPTTQQILTSSAFDLIINQTAGNIVYTPSTGNILLKSGSTYRIRANGYMVPGASVYINWRLTDTVNNVPFLQTLYGNTAKYQDAGQTSYLQMNSVNNNTDYSDASSKEWVIAPTANINIGIELISWSSSNLPGDIKYVFFQFEVVQPNLVLQGNAINSSNLVVNQGVNFTGYTIQANNPVNAQDVSTKSYVDTAISTASTTTSNKIINSSTFTSVSVATDSSIILAGNNAGTVVTLMVVRNYASAPTRPEIVFFQNPTWTMPTTSPISTWNTTATTYQEILQCAYSTSSLVTMKLQDATSGQFASLTYAPLSTTTSQVRLSSANMSILFQDGGASSGNSEFFLTGGLIGYATSTLTLFPYTTAITNTNLVLPILYNDIRYLARPASVAVPYAITTFGASGTQVLGSSSIFSESTGTSLTIPNVLYVNNVALPSSASNAYIQYTSPIYINSNTWTGVSSQNYTAFLSSGVIPYQSVTSTQPSSVSLWCTGRVVCQSEMDVYSDIRKKQILDSSSQVIEDATNIIRQMKFHRYVRNDVENAGEQCGIIAQELKEIYPSCVTEDESEDKFLLVSKDKLFEMNLAVTQGLLQRVDRLEQQIQLLLSTL